MTYAIYDTEYNDLLEVIRADSYAEARAIANRKYPTHLSLLVKEASK